MTIIYNPTFERQVIQIVNFIADDKPSASVKFANELENLLLLFQKIHLNTDNLIILKIRILEIWCIKAIQ